MTTTFERRFAEIEAALDELAPRPSEFDEFKAKWPALDWLTGDELMTLCEMLSAADVATLGDLDEVGKAKAASIYFEAEVRRLSGAPKDCDLPKEPFDLQASYLKSKRAAELKGR
jgi:hypothetical protein